MRLDYLFAALLVAAVLAAFFVLHLSVQATKQIAACTTVGGTLVRDGREAMCIRGERTVRMEGVK